MPFTQISLWFVESNFCFPHVILSIFVLVGVDFRKKYSVISLFSTTMLKNLRVYFESFGGKSSVEERNKIID